MLLGMESIIRKQSRMYSDSSGIFHIEVASMYNAKDAEVFVRRAEELAKSNSSLVGLPTLIDMRGVNIHSYLPHREIFRRSAKVGQPRKAAVLGENRLLWIFVSFLFSAAGIIQTQKKVRFFTSENEAIQWLRKEE